MPDYKRDTGHLKYRKVYLFGNGEIPAYEDFTSEYQSIRLDDNGVVLEVLKADGKSELYCKNEPKDIVYGYSLDGKGFWINASESDKICARLWVQKEHGSQTRYKIPAGMTKTDGTINVRTLGTPNGMILVGDKYFEKAYHLVRA